MLKLNMAFFYRQRVRARKGRVKATEEPVAQRKRHRVGFATPTHQHYSQTCRVDKSLYKNDKHILGLFLKDVHRLHNHKSSCLN